MLGAAADRRPHRSPSHGKGEPVSVVLGVVALGGVIGSLGRWLVGLGLPGAGSGFAWGTLAVNLTGALAMGLLVGWLSDGDAASEADEDGVLADREIPASRVDPAHVEPWWVRPFAMTGLLGGWTTYSALALDVHTLGSPAGVTYLATTLIAGVAACLAGLVLGERLSGRAAIAKDRA